MKVVARLAALFGTTVFVCYLSLEFSSEVGRVAAIWPLNAIVLALLAQQPRRAWPTILAVVFAANLATNMWMGDSPSVAFGLAVANSFEAAFCAQLLFGGSRVADMALTRSLVRFFCVAGVAGPAGSAVIGALVLSGDRSISEVMLQWFLADSLGMLVFAPALLVFSTTSDLIYRKRSAAEKWISVLALSAALLLVFGQRSYPLLYCIPPALVLTTFRLGVHGAAIGILVTALVAITATIAGMGPILLVQDVALSRLYVLQSFLAFLSLVTLPIAATLARAESILADSINANSELMAARKLAEDSRSEVLEYAQRYRDIADYATDIVLRFGPGGRISYASPAIRILGMDPEEVVGKRVSDLVIEEDRISANVAIDELFDDPGMESEIRREFRAYDRAGSVIWLEDNPTVVYDSAKVPVEVVSSYRDVTARRNMMGELRSARESAEKATVAKTEFLANMSHELRTPLNSIVGFSQLLANAQQLDPGLRRYVDVISFSSLGLLSVVNDVLDFSSLEAGALKLEARPFSLGQLATQVVDSMQVAADDKGLTLSLALDETIAAQHLGDEGRLRQVLLNLLSNAVKFTESGSVKLSLKASDSGSAQQTLMVAVTDTGMGIPEDRLASVFTRFEQLDGSINRHFGGAGLGLAIVKYLVELMGGAVSVESVQGQGSQFHVTLSLAKHSELATPRDSMSTLPKQPNQGVVKILVVDDVELNRELVLAQLAGYGHQLDVAGNGAEALQLVQENDYGLVLMDIRMPVMDGLSATRAIRQIPRLLHLPIIALTAQALPEQIRACSEAGMNDYLSKPVATDALRDSVHKWIGTNEPVASSESDVFQRLSDRFLVRCAAELQLIRDRQQAVSAEELHDSIHRLAGSARMFGLAELSDAARGIDQKLSGDEIPTEIEYEKLINALQFIVENPSTLVHQLS